MRALLLSALMLAPLAASSSFSEFEIPKWLLSGVAATLALILAWRDGLDDYLRRHPGLVAAFGGIALLGIVSILSAWTTDPWAAFIDLIRLALPVSLLALCGFAWQERSKTAVLTAGASLPLLLVLSQFALERDLFPVDVPHRAGSWTATIGNGALLAEAVLVQFAYLAILLRHLDRTRGLAAALLFGLPAIFLLAIGDSRAVWAGSAVFAVLWCALEALHTTGNGGAIKMVKKAGLPSALLLGGLCLFAFLLPAGSLQAGFATRLQSMIDPDHPTNIVREELAEDASEMARAHLLTGVGGGRFGAVHYRVRSPREWRISGLESRVEDPHNEYLRIFAEYGLAGVVILGALVIGLMRSLWKRRRCAVARCTLAMWAGMLVIASVWGTFLHPATTIPLFALTGLALGANKQNIADETERGARWRGALVAVLLGTATLCAGLWAERDAAAVSLRDQSETRKRAFAEAAEAGGPEAARALSDLGLTGASILRVAGSGWLRPSLRYRLLRGVSDLAEDRRLLTQIQAAPENEVAGMLLNAAKTLPKAADVRSLADRQLTIAPPHLPTLRLLGRLEALNGNKSAAVLRLEEALAVNSADPFANQLLAELYVEGDTQLYEMALKHTDAQLAHWGDVEAAGDHAWQLKARCLGALGRVDEALACIEDSVEALGESDPRRAVAGELSLFFGETPKTVGLFITDEDEWGRRQERGAFVSSSFEGLPPAELRLKLLAHLGKHPHDTPVLERLRDVLFDIQKATGDRDAGLERMRDRAISRSRIHFAWENLGSGNERNLRVCLRVARRKSTRQGDAWLIEIIQAVRNNDMGRSLDVLKDWKKQGFATFPALQKIPELAPFCAEPEVQALLGS